MTTPGSAPPSPTSTPVAAGLWDQTSEDTVALRAGLCTACGAWAFPVPASCARCSSVEIVEASLPERGTLWSWTIQRFEPKEPYDGARPFEPYGVGYVEFEGKVIAEGRLTVRDPHQLSVGMAMDTCLVDYADGSHTYAFRPARGAH